MENQENNRDGERLIQNISRPVRQNQNRQQPQAPARLINLELALPWRQRVPTNEDCEIVVFFFNLNMEMLRRLHREHVARAERCVTEDPLAVLGGIIPARPTSYQEYIFNCSLCYELFSILHLSLSYVQGYRPIYRRVPRSYRRSFNGPPRPNSSPVPNLPSPPQQYVYDIIPRIRPTIIEKITEN